MFLFILPIIMTSVEITGIVLYSKDLRIEGGHIPWAYFVLMGFALIPATWFQYTLIKWAIFVRKYTNLRNRRVRQLLIRMD